MEGGRAAVEGDDVVRLVVVLAPGGAVKDVLLAWTELGGFPVYSAWFLGWVKDVGLRSQIGEECVDRRWGAG